MKKTKLLFFIVCFVALFMLTACKSDNKNNQDKPKVDEWEFSANTLEEAKAIYEDFFYLTIYNDNMIVTVSNDDGVIITETLDGEKDHVKYNLDEEYFVYKDGNDYYVAVRDGKNKYYFKDEDKYDEYGLAFAFYLDVLSDLETEGMTISLKSKGTSTHTEYDILIDAKLTLEINYENHSINVTAEKVKDKVVSFKSTYTDEDESYTVDIKFEFGKASVALPDISDWFNALGPKVPSEWYVTGTIGGTNYDEIPMYFDYVTGYYNTDYVDIILGDNITVKNKNDATISFNQKIDEDYLTGHEMISFDSEQEVIYFESETE